MTAKEAFQKKLREEWEQVEHQILKPAGRDVDESNLRVLRRMFELGARTGALGALRLMGQCGKKMSRRQMTFEMFAATVRKLSKELRDIAGDAPLLSDTTTDGGAKP